MNAEEMINNIKISIDIATSVKEAVGKKESIQNAFMNICEATRCLHDFIKGEVDEEQLAQALVIYKQMIVQIICALDKDFSELVVKKEKELIKEIFDRCQTWQ